MSDHGPAKKARREGVVIDLSQAAARELELLEDGRTEVRIERLDDGK